MKNLLILGATSDIAQAIAKKYANAGWRLTLGALETDLLDSIVCDLRIRYDASVEAVEFDATDYGIHRRLYESLPEKPDVVITAFGYLGNNILSRTDFDAAHHTLAVNYIGAASILSIVADDFEKRGSGAIVGISSVAGERGRQGGYMYASTKAALTSLLSGLRNRLCKAGVHVMTVKAGFCRTKMTENVDFPSGLCSAPEQVADAVYQGLEKRKNEIYTLRIWRWIMFAVRHLPEPVFKRVAYTRLRY